MTLTSLKLIMVSMVERPAKTPWFPRGAILGWISLIVISGLAVFGFQIIQQRNSLTLTPGQLPRISSVDLKREMDTNLSLIIVDVRSKEEYDASHIAGAVSIPSDEISLRYKELKGYKNVITYCT